MQIGGSAFEKEAVGLNGASVWMPQVQGAREVTPRRLPIIPVSTTYCPH